MKEKIVVIGLGYVGLPLAVEFGKKYETIGFDINSLRIKELASGIDKTLECTSKVLDSATNLSYTADVNEIKDGNIYIITVPTPVDKNNTPDLKPLISASKLVGSVIGKGDIVIYESTVYPGATEEECVPVIELSSSLLYNKDFFVGYSPERINPGDKKNTLTKIKKVTSGSTREVANKVDDLYSSIITAGTYKAESIKVAEASKVIENVQRDVNIALVNELHQIFSRMEINTMDVINAASTKWNFMSLTPGLVGGHCIGVDPYYLLHKSKVVGYIPDLIRKSREINNMMPSYVADDFLKFVLKNKINPVDCNVALLGFTFKENCPDIRNTKVYDLYLALSEIGFKVKIYDPWASVDEVKNEYGVVIEKHVNEGFDVALLAVHHKEILSQLEVMKDKCIYSIK